MFAPSNKLNKIDLTKPAQLSTLVENRRIFNMRHCELNVFESYQQAQLVPLTFGDLVITSMVRGKKVMHLFDHPSFDYVPGETVIVPANETMRIDFPEAATDNPTQCIALAVSDNHLQQTLHFLNEHYQQPDKETHWNISFQQYHFENDAEVSALINKIMRISMSTEKAKDIYADLTLKELLVRLVQSQQLFAIEATATTAANSSRLHAVIDYIQQHLHEKLSIEQLCKKAYLNRNDFFRLFKEQFGLTPVDYINQQRIKRAKELMRIGEDSLSNISWRCGFSDVNYFSRLFRKMEGMAPSNYFRQSGA